ncbi:MAG: hypothetical protein OXC14_21110 [Rhodospirillaceae bacterium]|nr:hypothetical protein [Rhodospirillaceae bacterium]
MLQLNRRQVLKAGGTLGAVSAMSPMLVAAKGDAAAKADLSGLPRVKQELVAPPFAPAHEQTSIDGPKIIEVELTVHEDKREIDDNGTMVIWIASCRVSSVADSGMSMRRQILGSSS